MKYNARGWSIVALAVAAISASNQSASGGEVSENVGTITKLIGDGYKFVASGGIGSEQTSDVGFGHGNSHYQTGFLYLEKQNDILLCVYRVVFSNPSIIPPSEPDFWKPGSSCYRIK
jgi:hypothetical protein